MPANFRLVLDPSTRVGSSGAVLMGGTPFRVVRLSGRHAAALAAWRRGEPIGADDERRWLARALVSTNLAQPSPPPAVPSGTPAVTERGVSVVVPVHDRPRQLRRLLGAIRELPDFGHVREVVVVDDASRDPDGTARVVEECGARLVRRGTQGGAAAARNTGAAATGTRLVAFLDSDCVPRPGWLSATLPHFADPLVGLVAPRVVALAERQDGWLARYEGVRSPLDRGGQAGRVLPGGQVPFVPGAALVLRRDSFGNGFDETLRGGEDVDLVWRLTEEGWHVRYEPGSQVAHEHRTSPRSWLSRRAYYGRTAAPLARRHPGAARPLSVSPWTAAAWGAAGLRRPAAAAGIVGLACILLARELTGVVDHPTREAFRLAGAGTVRSGLSVADALVRAWWPVTVGAAAVLPRLRLPVAAAAVAPSLLEWRRLRPPIDPVRWTVARVLDDAAYGWGVWSGCWVQREWGPVTPDLGWRLAVETSDELVDHVRAQARLRSA